MHIFCVCVICNYSKHMTVSKNKSRDGTHKLTYRCYNPDCARLVKSFRAKHVFNSIADMHDRLELTVEAYEQYSEQIDELVRKQADLENDINMLNDKIVDPSQIKVSKEEFLNTLQAAFDKIRAAMALEKDRVCRILFLNLPVDNEGVATYHWREPFKSLVKVIANTSGADERT